MLRRNFLWPLALAGAAFAAQPGLERQGPYWVETITGTEAVSPSGNLRINSRGPVTVTGIAGGSLQYTLTKRVKARNEADARRHLQEFQFKISRTGETTVINLAESNGKAELAVRAPKSLQMTRIDTHGGRVVVTDMDGTVQAGTGGGPMHLDRIGGPMIARTAGGEISVGTVRGSARCSTAGGAIRAQSIGGEANCETAGGDIVIGSAGGPVRASTAGGSIRIERAGATVSADTAGGSIDVGQAVGMVRADTSGGSIDVGGAVGVRCESAGGGIRLSKVTGSVRASTAVGSVVAQLLASGFSGGYLSTSAGDITVFIPSNLPVTIKAENTAVAAGLRRIISEYPEVNVRLDGSLVIGQGAINGGGPILRLTGSGGTIYIKRQQ